MLWVARTLVQDEAAEADRIERAVGLGEPPEDWLSAKYLSNATAYPEAKEWLLKSKGLHENCIQQINRLYREFLFTDGDVPTDSQRRIRVDDWEMREDVQADVMDLWHRVTTENAKELTDIEGFKEDFLHQHGFGVSRVDYVDDVDPMLV